MRHRALIYKVLLPLDNLYVLVKLTHMDLEQDFARKPARTKNIMVRFSDDEYKEVQKLAKRYQASMGETIRVLSLKMLGQVMMGVYSVSHKKTPSTKKRKPLQPRNRNKHVSFQRN